MFVGYVLNHEGNGYRMWDPDTGRVHISRDITQLNPIFLENNSPRENYTRRNLLTNEDGETKISSNTTRNSAGYRVGNENINQSSSYENTDRNKILIISAVMKVLIIK